MESWLSEYGWATAMSLIKYRVKAFSFLKLQLGVMVPGWNQSHHLVGRGRRTQVQVHLHYMSRPFLKIKIASAQNNKHFPY